MSRFAIRFYLVCLTHLVHLPLTLSLPVSLALQLAACAKLDQKQ